MGLNIWQVALVVGIIALLFGRGRIPGLMADMAAGIKSFKQGMREDDTSTVSNDAPPAPDTPTNSAALCASSKQNAPHFASSPLAVPAAPSSPCVPAAPGGSLDSQTAAAPAAVTPAMADSSSLLAGKSDA